jgi:hypothetical protein
MKGGGITILFLLLLVVIVVGFAYAYIKTYGDYITFGISANLDLSTIRIDPNNPIITLDINPTLHIWNGNTIGFKVRSLVLEAFDNGFPVLTMKEALTNLELRAKSNNSYRPQLKVHFTPNTFNKITNFNKYLQSLEFKYFIKIYFVKSVGTYKDGKVEWVADLNVD